MTTITIRARAFTGSTVRPVRCLVEPDGTVRVWDSVAGHWTTCHALTADAQRRARKAAGVSA